jgi:PAS domain-containing protein
LIVSVLLGVYALSGWRPGRGWILLGGAFAFQAVFDTVYLYQAASGTYQTGGVLDLVWPVVMLMVALAAWHRPEPTRSGELLGWPALAITSGFAVAGLFLTTYDHWYPVNDVAVVLASLTLIAAFVRTAMTFGDMKTLSRGKELSLRNGSILRAAGEGIYGIDRDGMVTFANPAATRMTGHAIDELIGRRSHDVVHHTEARRQPLPRRGVPLRCGSLRRPRAPGKRRALLAQGRVELPGGVHEHPDPRGRPGHGCGGGLQGHHRAA